MLCHFSVRKTLYRYPCLLTQGNPKKIFTLCKKVRSKNSILPCVGVSCCRSHGGFWQRQRPLSPISFPRTTLSVPASSLGSFELCLWVSLLYPELFCASGRTGPQVSENPHRGYFWGLGTLKKIFFMWVNANCFFALHHFDLGKFL